jgi:DNA topoisomerase IB
VIAAVAGMLRNTPAICRKSYIDPKVFEAWESGQLAKTVRGVRGARQWEQALLRLLSG